MCGVEALLLTAHRPDWCCYQNWPRTIQRFKSRIQAYINARGYAGGVTFAGLPRGTVFAAAGWVTTGQGGRVLDSRTSQVRKPARHSIHLKGSVLLPPHWQGWWGGRDVAPPRSSLFLCTSQNVVILQSRKRHFDEQPSGGTWHHSAKELLRSAANGYRLSAAVDRRLIQQLK